MNERFGPKMSDAQYIEELVRVASVTASLLQIEQEAAAKLLAYTKQTSNGCAITLSCLLQHAGIDVADTYGAYELVDVLKARGWVPVPIQGSNAGMPVRDLLPGDVGTTCHGAVLHPGYDHVYLVLRSINPNENVVADNERHYPHLRSIDGRGDVVTPSYLFLRAQ